jgi:hypothetical protein
MDKKRNKYEVGDFVIYHKPKSSPTPGPRAKNVQPAEHGDNYSYIVDKFWVISRILDEETIEARTRTGKAHRIKVDDPLLRKANLKEKLLLKERFPDLDDLPDG